MAPTVARIMVFDDNKKERRIYLFCLYKISKLLRLEETIIIIIYDVFFLALLQAFFLAEYARYAANPAKPRAVPTAHFKTLYHYYLLRR